MKTLIKILCLSVLSFILTQDKVITKNDYVYEGNIIEITDHWVSIYIDKERIDIDKNIVKSIQFSNGKTIEYNEIKKIRRNKTNKEPILKEPILSAGEHLKKFRSYYYLGVMCTLTGTLSTVSDNGDNKLGAGLTIIGMVLTLFAINEIGEAGEDLEKVKIKK